jgi:hypothetical protein
MRRRGFVGVTFLCVLASLPLSLVAQDQGSGASSRSADAGFELLQNYPNPFTTATRIPFRLDISLFEQGQPAVVTMRIFNVLQQLVAYPTALGHPAGEGAPVNGLEYTSPGAYEALWDAHDLNGRQVAAGIYYLQINVNGRRQIMKMMRSN